MFLSVYDRQLKSLQECGRMRTLTEARGYDFASNDYLGLANSSEVKNTIIHALERGVPVGSGGSRLLRGNHPAHEALERNAAQFFGSEAALFFSTGYAANSVLLATLPQTGDLIIFDELIHASSHEGIRLTRASSCAALHNDPDSIESKLVSWRRAGGVGTPWIVVETLYSMDGDLAPIEHLAEIAARHDAILIADEAHATGVFGRGGRGLAEAWSSQENVIALRTCGKALGCEGAIVCAPRVIIDFLVNRARSFIFSTAPSPLIAEAVNAALGIVSRADELRERLGQLCELASNRLKPFGVRSHGTQILPLIVGKPERAMEVARHIQQAGFDVRGIRPPSVPEGTSRLRISITLNVNEDAIIALTDCLAEVLS